MNYLEFQKNVEDAGMPYYKAISLFLKTRDEYIAENNLDKETRTMNEFLHEIYPEHYGRIFERFCKELKQ